MKILSKVIKKLPDKEQIIGKVTNILPGGTVLVLGNQGRRINATNDSNQRLVVGDNVTVILSTPPSIVGKTSFRRDVSKVITI